MHFVHIVLFIAKDQGTDTPLDMVRHRFSQAQVKQWFENVRRRDPRFRRRDPLQPAIAFPTVDSGVATTVTKKKK